MKTCRICGQEFPAETSGPKRRICRECKNAQERERSKTPANREKRRGRSVSRYQQGRPIIDSLKNKPCADCGILWPPCAMEFDHPDPKVKSFTISKWAGGGITPSLLAEIAKCDLICACCHRIRTQRQRELGIISRGGRPRKVSA